MYFAHIKNCIQDKIKNTSRFGQKHCHQKYIHQVESFNPCIEQVQPANALILIFFSQKSNPKTYKNYIFIKVAEALVHLGLRLNSTLPIVKQLINLAKNTAGVY
jgi:hypothetical protein